MKLILPVKSEYFYQIKSGEKIEEYRLYNDYWKKRLIGKEFDSIEITRGYPSKHDYENRISRPWNGYEIKTITHKHFGENAVTVFAIKL